jgi:hypothetical protein
MRTLYDAQGRKYELPQYVISDPVNMSPPPSDGTVQGDIEPVIDAHESDLSESGSEILDPEEIMRRKEEKGKGPEKTILATKSVFTVKLRKTTTTAFQDDIAVPKFCETDTVGRLKERLMEDGHVRLFYRGQELADTKTLKQYGYVPGDVLSAMVT